MALNEYQVSAQEIMDGLLVDMDAFRGTGDRGEDEGRTPQSEALPSTFEKPAREGFYLLEWPAAAECVTGTRKSGLGGSQQANSQPRLRV